MIIVRSADIANTARHVSGPGWDSKRMIVRDDGMGYSVHETRILEGTESHLHYKPCDVDEIECDNDETTVDVGECDTC